MGSEIVTKMANSRTRCEVFSRVCGYLRPTKQWNEGKLAEWEDRKTFKAEKND